MSYSRVIVHCACDPGEFCASVAEERGASRRLTAASLVSDFAGEERR